MKNPSAALNVTLNLWIWRYMKIRTKMKNNSAALHVTPNLWILLIYRCMKIRTNMKNHSAALNSTLNPQIWGSEDKWKLGPKWKIIQLLFMRLQICESCWFKGTWKSGQHEKPFSCSSCDSKSANPADLKIHENQDQNSNSIQLLSFTKNDILVWKSMKENPNFAC